MSKFQTLIDTPDITLLAGQYIDLEYSFMWAGIMRTRHYRKRIESPIHLKDLVKMKEKALRVRWTAEGRKEPKPFLYSLVANIHANCEYDIL